MHNKTFIFHACSLHALAQHCEADWSLLDAGKNHRRGDAKLVALGRMPLDRSRYRETNFTRAFSQVKTKVFVLCTLVSRNAGILVARSCLSLEQMSTTATITMWPVLGMRMRYPLPRTVEQLCTKLQTEATIALLTCCCSMELNLGQSTGEVWIQWIFLLNHLFIWPKHFFSSLLFSYLISWFFALAFIPEQSHEHPIWFCPEIGLLRNGGRF